MPTDFVPKGQLLTILVFSTGALGITISHRDDLIVWQCWKAAVDDRCGSNCCARGSDGGSGDDATSYVNVVNTIEAAAAAAVAVPSTTAQPPWLHVESDRTAHGGAGRHGGGGVGGDGEGTLAAPLLRAEQGISISSGDFSLSISSTPSSGGTNNSRASSRRRQPRESTSFTLSRESTISFMEKVQAEDIDDDDDGDYGKHDAGETTTTADPDFTAVAPDMQQAAAEGPWPPALPTTEVHIATDRTEV